MIHTVYKIIIIHMFTTLDLCPLQVNLSTHHGWPQAQCRRQLAASLVPTTPTRWWTTSLLVCVCVCVCERERGREGGREGGRVCVYVISPTLVSRTTTGGGGHSCCRGPPVTMLWATPSSTTTPRYLYTASLGHMIGHVIGTL